VREGGRTAAVLGLSLPASVVVCDVYMSSVNGGAADPRPNEYIAAAAVGH